METFFISIVIGFIALVIGIVIGKLLSKNKYEKETSDLEIKVDSVESVAITIGVVVPGA